MPNWSDDIAAIVSRDLQGIELSDDRVTQLAAELRRLNTAVLNEVGALSFDLEPANFAALLEELSQ